MKTILTLFVLLFSSSVVAGDDLAGKKIFCIKNPDTAHNIGFDFIKNNKVNFFLSLYLDEFTRVATFHGKYRTTANAILITLDKTPNPTYEIDRKNLSVVNIGENLKDSEDDIVILNPDICEVIEIEYLYQHIKKIYDEQVLVIKSKNKI